MAITNGPIAEGGDNDINDGEIDNLPLPTENGLNMADTNDTSLLIDTVRDMGGGDPG